MSVAIYRNVPTANFFDIDFNTYNNAYSNAEN